MSRCFGLRPSLLLAVLVAGMQVAVTAVAAGRGPVQEREAQSAMDSGRMRQAAVIYQQLLHEQPDNNGYRMQLAKCLELSGEYDAAEQQAQQVLSADSNNVDGLQLMGRVSLQNADWKAAEQYFQRVLKVDDAQPQAHIGLGQALMQLGEMDAAESHFEAFRRLTENTGQ